MTIYALSKVFNDNLLAVENVFTTKLYEHAMSNIKNGVIINTLTDTLLSKRVVGNSNLVDLKNLQGVSNKFVYQDIVDFRFEQLKKIPDFASFGDSFKKENGNMLYIDYLLMLGVCYVEIIQSNTRVDKFFATRNRFLVEYLTGVQDSTLLGHLSLTPYDYMNKKLKIVKLSFNKKGVKVTKARNPLDFNLHVKVTPLFLMDALVKGIYDLLANHMIKFTYIKDNMTLRDLVSTMNAGIINQYYGSDYTQKVLNNTSKNLDRGYIRVPELGLSRYDETGVRALNITRLVGLEIIDHFDTSFIDVDFDLIHPYFTETILSLRNELYLKYVYENLTGNPAPNVSRVELQNLIISFIDNQVAIGTTSALRVLHKYMISKPQIFVGYSGKKSTQGFYKDNFNLGLS